MSVPDGLVAWTDRRRAAEAAKLATMQTGARHRAVKTHYLDWHDFDGSEPSRIPCYVLVLDTGGRP